MALELPGVRVIEDPVEARAHGRRWNTMARELDTPGAPPEAKAKARELRQRAQAAHDWARRQEDALLRARVAHDEHLASVSRSSSARDAGATIYTQPGHARRAARAAGHRAYHAARPRAMRLGHRGRQHLFQGAASPFAGAATSGYELAFEAVGATLGVILLALLLRSPHAIGTTSSHLLGFLQRAAQPVDPLTGTRVASGGGNLGSVAVGAQITKTIDSTFSKGARR